MRILLVEDDVQLAELLERVFCEEGHASWVCGTLAAAENAFAAENFDIVVLDWMLPDGDGIELCNRLRTRLPPLPVLMLTARGELHDRVSGLQSGADDYVTKPFEIEELLARLEAVHRRVHRPWFTQAGFVEIDHRAQTIRVEGRRLELTSKEYALLARIAEVPNECVSRAALLSDVWNLAFDPGSGVIDVHVSRLRNKLGDHAWMIETVRGHGLRLRTSR